MDVKRQTILKLIRSKGVGPVTFWTLMSMYNNNVELALAHLPKLAAAGGNHKYQICEESAILHEINETKNHHAKYLFYIDEHFPTMLKKIATCPPVLIIKDDNNFIEQLNKKKIIAMVGCRNASFSGRKFAQDISRALSTEHDYLIVSGFARGIDENAHIGSANNIPIAILPCGINIIYPLDNKDLYNIIVKNGILISEVPCGTEPQFYSFLVRNRLIAGIAHITIVIEAGMKSGSLNTAKYAMEYNRLLAAVPGDPTDIRKRGTNFLIKNKNAILVESTSDILSYMENTRQNVQEEPMEQKSWIVPTDNEINEAQSKILEFSSSCPVSLELISDILSVDIRIIMIAVVQLELADKIQRTEDNMIYRIQ